MKLVEGRLKDVRKGRKTTRGGSVQQKAYSIKRVTQWEKGMLQQTQAPNIEGNGVVQTSQLPNELLQGLLGSQSKKMEQKGACGGGETQRSREGSFRLHREATGK